MLPPSEKKKKPTDCRRMGSNFFSANLHDATWAREKRDENVANADATQCTAKFSTNNSNIPIYYADGPRKRSIRRVWKSNFFCDDGWSNIRETLGRLRYGVDPEPDYRGTGKGIWLRARIFLKNVLLREKN